MSERRRRKGGAGGVREKGVKRGPWLRRARPALRGSARGGRALGGLCAGGAHMREGGLHAEETKRRRRRDKKKPKLRLPHSTRLCSPSVRRSVARAFVAAKLTSTSCPGRSLWWCVQGRGRRGNGEAAGEFFLVWKAALFFLEGGRVASPRARAASIQSSRRREAAGAGQYARASHGGRGFGSFTYR